jgi:DnaK suppressor protein
MTAVRRSIGPAGEGKRHVNGFSPAPIGGWRNTRGAANFLATKVLLVITLRTQVVWEKAMKIEDIRQRLKGQRRALLQQVAQVEDNLRWLDTNVEPEIEEEGQEANIARLLERLDDRERAELDEIDRALARIETGEYGRCTVCAQLIPEGRLEALPATEACLECAQARERLQS